MPKNASSAAAALVAASLLAASLLAAPAAASELIPAECAPLVGTFVTKNSLPDGKGGTLRTRSLISLTNGGHAFRSDSDQNSGLDQLSFGDSQGAWRCLGKEGESLKLTARMINFSYPASINQQTAIARIDYRGTYDPAEGTLRLVGELSFLTVDSDPDTAKPAFESVQVEVTGYKIVAPQ